MKDTLYIDHSNGGYEMYVYSDTDRYYVGFYHDKEMVTHYAKLHRYKVVWLK